MIKLKILFILLLCSISVHNVKAQLSTTELKITDGIESESVKIKIENNVSALLTACNEAVMEGKKPKIPSEIMTKEAQKIFQQLWKNSEMSCFVSTIEEKCLKRPVEGYQIRNIPVFLMAPKKEKEGDQQEQEQEIIINLTSDGKIDDIFLAIDANKYAEIMGKNISVQDLNRRQIIIDFIERFRTSYNRKDIEYIEKVFSNDALIITGKIIKQVPRSDQAIRSLAKEKIEYQISTKEQYIKNLRERTFKRNKYINIVFNELKVIRHPVFEDIYGVTLKQDWNSSTYNDVGYLFLMIDFRDQYNPLIQVRTWQPTEYNNKPLARDEIFNLGSFDEIVRDKKQ